MATAEIFDENGNKILNYYMEDRLKKSIDNKIKAQLKKKDKDCVIVIDGKEGSGKSTFAFQIGRYVDPTLDVKRVCFSPEEFREAVLKAKRGECIIYDEAFTGFSSRSSLSPVNKVLVSLAMQMRQKNLFIIIVLPTIFLLDKYMAIFRTKILLHVYESKGIRGYFKLYNARKKKYLILMGAKTMSYHVKGLWTRFGGRFYGKFALGDDSAEEEYRKRKEKALGDSEKLSMTSAQVKYRHQRDIVIYLLRKITKMKYQEMSNLLSNYELVLSLEQISKICAAYGDKKDNPAIKEKITEDSEKIMAA